MYFCYLRSFVRLDGKKKGNEKDVFAAEKMPPQEATIENPKEIIKSKKEDALVC